MIDIPTYIKYARVAQAKDTVKIANQNAFQGGTTVPDYTRLLEIVRKSVEFMYANNPNNPTLESVANYMYNLSGKRPLTPTAPVSPFVIIVQPQSQTINSGSNVTFSVAVAGGTSPYTYQWYYNNGVIGGATSSSYTITGAVTGDAGNYKCIIMDANSQTLTSSNATLTVNAVALAADWYWNATIDPYPALAGGTDNLVYLGSVSFSHLDPIIIPWPSGSADNVYRVVRYPIGEGAKILWVNTGINQGPIPGTAYNEIVTIGSNLYIISKGDSVFTPFTVTYT